MANITVIFIHVKVYTCAIAKYKIAVAQTKHLEQANIVLLLSFLTVLVEKNSPSSVALMQEYRRLQPIHCNRSF